MAVWMFHARTESRSLPARGRLANVGARIDVGRRVTVVVPGFCALSSGTIDRRCTAEDLGDRLRTTDLRARANDRCIARALRQKTRGYAAWQRVDDTTGGNVMAKTMTKPVIGWWDAKHTVTFYIGSRTSTRT